MFLIFVFIECHGVFIGRRNVVGYIEGGGLLFDRRFFFDIIVENFTGIGELNDWFVVGNHASRTGTLTL